MPLLFEQNMPYEGSLGVWRIKESEQELRNRLELFPDEIERLATIKGEGRRIEWLAARLLTHHLLGGDQRLPMVKDQYGKPYIEGLGRYISLSHSDEMAAVVVSNVPCGVDIQVPVEKIKRLAPKYCSTKEFKSIYGSKAMQTMHIIWGAKECMYKAYGKRELDYRKHLYVHDAISLMEQPSYGRLKKNKLLKEYDIGAEYVLDYVLTYCFEKPI